MLVAISAAHGRHALTRLWAEHTASLGFDAVVVCLDGWARSGVATTDEADNSLTCAAWEFIAVYEPNDPLAGKFNAALKSAMELGATRIMILPSDDFVSQEWVDVARHSTADYIVPHACGVYSPPEEKAYVITKNSLTGSLRFGAGRVISRHAVDAVGGELWTPTINRGLDTASHHRLMAAGITAAVVPTSSIPITDVKTAENIWPFSAWQSGSKDISPDEALHMVSPDIREKLRSIR